MRWHYFAVNSRLTSRRRFNGRLPGVRSPEDLPGANPLET
jgi:hypothetical protein